MSARPHGSGKTIGRWALPWSSKRSPKARITRRWLCSREMFWARRRAFYISAPAHFARQEARCTTCPPADRGYSEPISDCHSSGPTHGPSELAGRGHHEWWVGGLETTFLLV